jgi:hypothetical protein
MKEGCMSRIVANLVGFFLLTLPAFANEKAGAPDYSGISYMYYTVIAVVFGYGVYDTFFKKS